VQLTENVLDSAWTMASPGCVLHGPNSGLHHLSVKPLEEEGKHHCPGRCSVTAYAGHDFYLTRNGAGCGFWEDGDWPKGIGRV
jgi:hypothetical protein